MKYGRANKKKKKKKRINRARNRIRLISVLICLVFLARGVSAEELQTPVQGTGAGSGQENPETDIETAEKPGIIIVLRPEKMEGEPDPDLSDEILAQILSQIRELAEQKEGTEENTDPAGGQEDGAGTGEETAGTEETGKLQEDAPAGETGDIQAEAEPVGTGEPPAESAGWESGEPQEEAAAGKTDEPQKESAAGETSEPQEESAAGEADELQEKSPAGETGELQGNAAAGEAGMLQQDAAAGETGKQLEESGSVETGKPQVDVKPGKAGILQEDDTAGEIGEPQEDAAAVETGEENSGEQTENVSPDQEEPDLTAEMEKLLERLFSRITWEFYYDEQIRPPGTDRPPGRSGITLLFDEDPEYLLKEPDNEEERSWLTTVAAEEQDPDPDETRPETVPDESGQGTGEGQNGQETGEDQNGQEAGPDENGQETGPDESGQETDAGQNGQETASGKSGQGNPGKPQSGESPVLVPAVPETAAPAGQTEAAAGPMPGNIPLTYTASRPVLRAESFPAAVPPEPPKSTEPRITLTHYGEKGAEDVTAAYREVLAAEDPSSVDWQRVLSVIPENDGIYTYRAVYTDAGGKEKTRESTFSVNRFGSVYLYNDLIRNLQQKTVRHVSGPLVITEYNPDKLVAGSWKAELIRDGRRIGHVQYSVTEKENTLGGQRAGWHCYEYIIPQENFRQDGVYRLMLSSRDTAGNTPESHAFNGGEITFAVDGTAPELLMATGLEEAVISGNARKMIGLSVFDSMGLEKVTFFLNGSPVYSVSEFPDRSRADLRFPVIFGEEEKQRISVQILDRAGNLFDSDARDEAGKYLFQPEYPFERVLSVRAAEERKSRLPARACPGFLAAAAASAAAVLIRKKAVACRKKK